ncbi:MAG: adenine nucleotide alpha hydrolase [Candidatus Aminicenantes bacterium]|nr:adenine nucleotide alpha hydrolase [Candidatus Aminicenantes bacterium]
MKKKTLLSWSSGKDSAWALHVLRRQPDINVVGLFCTVNQEFERVAMHAVRIELLHQQAQNIGLPVQLIPIPHPCGDAEYGRIMKSFVGQTKQQGIECFAFGDIFLEDVRKYREANLSASGITPIFPLWGMATGKLSREMVKGGLRAIITCIDPKHLSADFAGQEYGNSFLERIPANIDPCGENGEFHTFAYDGPMFIKPAHISIGETVSRDGFVFTDLLPAQQVTASS